MRTIALLALACVTITCAKREVAHTKTYVDSKRGVQFEYPGDWTAEELAAQNVLLLSSPVIEADWQTNIFIEMRRDLDRTSTPEQRLATLADNLSRTKKQFALQSTRVFTHANGLTAGELIYTHENLTDREVVLRMDGGKWLFVTGSAVTSLWSKYEPQLKIVFDSIRRIPTSAAASPSARLR
jgi:hypothetical protein